MRVFLLMPPFVPGFMRNARWDCIGISGSNWYPIYLACCTGLLEREKHETRFVDAQVANLSHEETYHIAREFAPDLTVIYFSSAALENDLKVGERIKEFTGCDVILVGHSASFDPVGTLKKTATIDMLAEGEFDFTVLDAANRVPKDKIRGLYWKNSKGEIVKNAPRGPVPAEELDKFPFVTDVYRRHLKIRDYQVACHGYPYVDLFTGRSCAWGHCTFCLWPSTINWGGGYRTRKMANVIEEIRFVREEMPYIKEIYIQDDVLPKERAVELAEAILDSKLKVRWSCYSRPNLDFETLKLMRRSGCYLLEVGFESSNLQILKNIKKGTTPSGMVEFVKNARKAGVDVIGAFITGLPGETVQSIKATTEFARKLPLRRYTITLPKPFPKTPFYQWLEANGYLKDGRPNYPHLSTEEIYKWNKWSLKQVYFSHNYLFRMLLKPSVWPSLFHSVGYFLPYVFSKEKREFRDLEW